MKLAAPVIPAVVLSLNHLKFPPCLIQSVPSQALILAMTDERTIGIRIIPGMRKTNATPF